MKSKVRLSTWSPGLDKIRLTKLIREEAAIPLNEAHEIVNRLLAGESIDVEFSSEPCAVRVAQDIRDLGVGAECLNVEIPANLPNEAPSKDDPAFRKAMEEPFRDHEDLYRRKAQ